MACIIAGRLLTADPTLKILVVESGHHSRDRQCHYQPCRFLENLAPTSTTVTFNAGKPSPLLNGRPLIVPCGRALGGGSTVNCKPMLPYITKYYRLSTHTSQSWCMSAAPHLTMMTGQSMGTKDGVRRTYSH